MDQLGNLDGGKNQNQNHKQMVHICGQDQNNSREKWKGVNEEVLNTVPLATGQPGLLAHKYMSLLASNAIGLLAIQKHQGPTTLIVIRHQQPTGLSTTAHWPRSRTKV